MAKIDRFHVHEALDRTYVLMAAFDTFVAQHPAIVDDPSLCLAADRVSDLMHVLYQRIGALRTTKKRAKK